MPGKGGSQVTTPLYQVKAEFFKTLGHPARIRVLELLSQSDHAVAEMLPQVGIEPAHLSQQLAVLRRANLVTSRKEGSTVYYSLTHQPAGGRTAGRRTADPHRCPIRPSPDPPRPASLRRHLMTVPRPSSSAGPRLVGLAHSIGL
jgi:DNA-binding transcriptional ArsR family regulator